MTEGEKRAKVEAVEKEFSEIKNFRKPVSENEEIPPICSMQIDKNNVYELEVQNSARADIVNLTTPIPAKTYDKRREQGKTSKEGSTRE